MTVDEIHDAKGEMMFLRVKCEGGTEYQNEFVSGVKWDPSPNDRLM